MACEYEALEQIWHQMEEEARRYRQLNEDYPAKEAALKSEVQQLQTVLSNHGTEQQRLLQQKEDMETQIRSLHTRVKQSESLFKQYNTDRNPQYRIQLMSQGTKLIARPLNNTPFPIDLTVAFHRSPSEGRQIGAVFYIILSKNVWEKSDADIWSIDMMHMVSGKVSGSFYLHFSSMQRNSEQVSIEFITQSSILFG